MGHGGDGAADTGGVMLDRSKVHILLCDKDPETGLQVMKLLRKCSYQVTCVKSAGQVMEVLDSSSFEVDLVLAEVELPKEKGFKMLKHIVRQEQLQRIPVVMMSAQDEMALVVRCLRLGAVDFLLKPLRSNELLNLWTHTWRRRRMLGLTEKHLTKGNLRVPFDLLVSETSESNNTNSTNLFSDDTDDCKVTTMMSTAGPGNYAFSQDMESEMLPRLELSLKPSLDVSLEVAPKHGSKAGWMPSPPRKSKLTLGQSSAFLTYNKVQVSRHPVEVEKFDAKSSGIHTTGLRSEPQSTCPGNDDSGLNVGENQEPLRSPTQPSPYVAPLEEHFSGRPPYHWESTSCRSENEVECREHSGPSTGNHAPLPCDLAGGKLSFSDRYSHEGAITGTSMASLPASHFLVGGMMGSVLHCPPPMLAPSVQLYHGLSTDDGVTAGVAAGIPSVHMPPSHGLNLITSFPYYPFGLHVAAAPQLGSFPGWHPTMADPLLERKLGQAERREAALNKFRLKRKDRCFEKKIRYVSRKKLAEQRPRIRGQFVRRETDTDAIENGVLDEYDDDDDERGLCDLGEGSSPESIAEDA